MLSFSQHASGWLLQPGRVLGSDQIRLEVGGTSLEPLCPGNGTVQGMEESSRWGQIAPFSWTSGSLEQEGGKICSRADLEAAWQETHSGQRSGRQRGSPFRTSLPPLCPKTDPMLRPVSG